MEHLSGHIKQVADNELIVVIEKKHLNRSDWEQGNKMLGREGNWDQFSEAVVTESTIDQIPVGVGKYLEQHFDEHDKFVFGASINGKKYMGGFIPLHDAGGQEVGEIVCLDDVTGAELSARAFSAAVVAVALVISGLILWFFYIMLGRMETNLAAAQDELEGRVHEKERIESQLRGQKERLKDEVWTRREAEGKLEEQVTELARAREAALNMMEDAESAKEQAEQARAELERANLQLEAAAEHANVLAQEALVANRTKSEFLANMSHEIRTPMNSVIGFSDVLAEEKLTEQQQEHVNLIRESGRHLLEIISDILDFSKVEAGKLDAELVECSLGSLLNSVESLMRPKARAKGLKFQIVQGKRLPCQIRTDPVRLRQCLLNLVSNAIKFTEQGHVHVNVGLHDGQGKAWICFDVEDTGIGIAADKQDTIFEAFTQADGGTTRRFGGTGLGLAITRRLTGLLGGKLTLNSEAGTGSVFSLVIPAGVDVAKQPFLDRHNIADQTPEPANKRPVKFSGRVLVAEDSPTNQMLAKLLLEKMGFDVTVAEDGDKAVQKALSQQFQLILMDIQMPNMNGYEATKALRDKSVTTPIVALTAHAMKGDEEKCLAAGCDDYLAKPINHEQLLKTIAKYVSVKNGDLSERIDSARSEVEQLSRLCSETKSPDVEESEHRGADTGQPSQS
jgi:signal transduction histidine kinase/DNA-binding NarL/FixJ family response regulator